MTLSRLRALTFAIILLAMLATLIILFVKSYFWRAGFRGLTLLYPYYLWAMVPYAILAWLTMKLNRHVLQAWVLLVGVLLIAGYGLVAYSYTLLLGHVPEFALVFYVVPLYQLVASFVLFVLVLLLMLKK